MIITTEKLKYQQAKQVACPHHTMSTHTESKLHSFFTSSRRALLRRTSQAGKQCTSSHPSSNTRELTNQNLSPSSSTIEDRPQQAHRSGPYLSNHVSRYSYQDDGVQFRATSAARMPHKTTKNSLYVKHALGRSLPVLKLVFSLLSP